MKAVIRSIVNYTGYFLSSKTINSLHSPMVYELIANTIEDGRFYYAFNELEAMRHQLLKMDDSIQIIDLGAGSKVNKSSNRKIKEIAKSALSPPHKAQFLFKLVNHLQPDRILELGTSLGLSAMYMNRGCKIAKLTTVEGSPAIANIAQKMFDIEKVDINLIQSPFDDYLQSTHVQDNIYQLVYIDGNHTETATHRYVDLLEKQLDEEGIIILDDIYWSQGMTNAWKVLRQDKRFAFSIDLFDYGILIKKKNQAHQAFKIIKRKYKPWSLGLWG